MPNHRLSKLIAFVAALYLFAPPPSAHAETETVQFATFAVKTFNINGRAGGSRPVTMFIDVANKKHADYVCAVAPRIRDALLVELTRSPVYLTPDGEFPVVELAERLKPVITDALQHDLIVNLGIVEGAVSLGSGAAAKLPYAQTGCARVSR